MLLSLLMFKIKLPNSELLVMKYEGLYDVCMQSIDHMSEIQLWSCGSCRCSDSVSSRCLCPPDNNVIIAPFTFTNTYSDFQWLLILFLCPHTLSLFNFFLLTMFSVHLYVLTLKLIISSSPSSRLWQQRQTVFGLLIRQTLLSVAYCIEGTQQKVTEYCKCFS